MTAREWLTKLELAWRKRDQEAIAALFAPAAAYHRGPFGAPQHGRRAISSHWQEVLSRQADPRIWFGEPIQAGERVSVEWWCILHDPATGAPRTAAGCLVLRFAPDGRCATFHEYWHAEPDAGREPPAGWFS